jgi:hypothetical protein
MKYFIIILFFIVSGITKGQQVREIIVSRDSASLFKLEHIICLNNAPKDSTTKYWTTIYKKHYNTYWGYAFYTYAPEPAHNIAGDFRYSSYEAYIRIYSKWYRIHYPLSNPLDSADFNTTGWIKIIR